MFHMVM